MFTEMAKYTKKEHSQVVWDCLFNAIDNLLGGNVIDDAGPEKLKYLLQLTEIWTEWKQGALVFDAEKLQNVSQYFNKCLMVYSALKKFSRVPCILSHYRASQPPPPPPEQDTQSCVIPFACFF